MVDQELSLFHDTAPILSITEIEAPLPASETLWLAKNAAEWLEAFQELYGRISSETSRHPLNPQTQSLCDLFQDLLHDNMNRPHVQLSPLQLRLLLHPLQSLLFHLRQVLSCFSDVLGARRGSGTVTKASTLLRLEEVQTLLQRWYDLSALQALSDPDCPVTRANIVLYHLISLNAVTSFPEIERLARKENYDGSQWQLVQRLKRSIYQIEEANFHSGQVLRLSRLMAVDDRPQWWSAALYRATMTLWVGSMSVAEVTFPKLGKDFPVDRVVPTDPAVALYMWNGEGIPLLTGGDGSSTVLEPCKVLRHCIDLFAEGVATRVSDGIRRKLEMLYVNWHGK